MPTALEVLRHNLFILGGLTSLIISYMQQSYFIFDTFDPFYYYAVFWIILTVSLKATWDHLKD